MQNERFLIYRCGWQGIGHIVVSIFNCLRAARDTGRTLAVDMSDCHYFSSDRHRRFFALFAFQIPPGVRLETDQHRIAALYADPDCYAPPAWTVHDPATDRPERVVVITANAITRIHTVANKPEFWPCRVALAGDLHALLAPRLLPPEPGTVTIGLYFRSGNGEFLDFRFDPISLPDYAARYQELLARYADLARVAAMAFRGRRVRYYVASDSQHFVAEMRARLGNVASRGSGGIAGQFRAAVEAANNGLEAIGDAVHDIWNMSACDALIYNSSLFPTFAILNSDTLNSENTYEVKTSTLYDILDRMSVPDATAYLQNAYWRVPTFWWHVRSGLLRFRANIAGNAGDDAARTALLIRAEALDTCFASGQMADALALYDQGQTEAASAMVATADCRENPYAMLFAAVIDATLGRYDTALETLRAIRATQPDLAEAYLAESKILASLGRTADACALLAEGLASCGDEPLLLDQRAVLFACLRPGGALINVAFNKIATQSSRSEWSRADDARGAVNGMMFTYFNMHTNHENHPWWAVDLAAIEQVRRILVYDRDYIHHDRPGRLIVESRQDDAAWCPVGMTSAQVTGISGRRPLDLWFDPPLAMRHVRVRLDGAGHLNLQQVEVYAERAGAR